MVVISYTCVPVVSGGMSQHNYWTRYSTEMALLFPYDSVFYAADGDRSSLLVSLDLSASFDVAECVPHGCAIGPFFHHLLLSLCLSLPSHTCESSCNSTQLYVALRSNYWTFYILVLKFKPRQVSRHLQHIPIVRSTPLSRPNSISGSQMSVCPSAKSFFNFNKIWCVCRGRWVMHDGMQYDPIQGQGHEPLKVGNLTFFKGYLLPHL